MLNLGASLIAPGHLRLPLPKRIRHVFLRHFKSQFSSLLVDFEEYSGGDEMPAIPPSLPDECVHDDEISELLEWCVDDHVRGPDFNPESMAHLA